MVCSSEFEDGGRSAEQKGFEGTLLEYVEILLVPIKVDTKGGL